MRNSTEKGTVHIGYMCKTDYEHHLNYDSFGATIYPSLESLKKNSPCVKECGIVKVTFVEIVQEEDYNGYF